MNFFLWIPKSCWLKTIQHIFPQCILIFQYSMNSLQSNEILDKDNSTYFPTMHFWVSPYCKIPRIPYIAMKCWVRTIQHAGYFPKISLSTSPYFLQRLRISKKYCILSPTNALNYLATPYCSKILGKDNSASLYYCLLSYY